LPKPSIQLLGGLLLSAASFGDRMQARRLLLDLAGYVRHVLPSLIQHKTRTFTARVLLALALHILVPLLGVGWIGEAQILIDLETLLP
jgi:hypothetical protein